MKILDIKKLLKGDILNDFKDDIDYKYAFAGDLMSDALSMIKDYNDQLILVTGLCNNQILHTANMLDINLIILVRNKHNQLNQLDYHDSNVTILVTTFTMFETCGLLYSNSIRGI